VPRGGGMEDEGGGAVITSDRCQPKCHSISRKDVFLGLRRAAPVLPETRSLILLIFCIRKILANEGADSFLEKHRVRLAFGWTAPF
jgi:hypothetical protein